MDKQKLRKQDIDNIGAYSRAFCADGSEADSYYGDASNPIIGIETEDPLFYDSDYEPKIFHLEIKKIIVINMHGYDKTGRLVDGVVKPGAQWLARFENLEELDSISPYPADISPIKHLKKLKNLDIGACGPDLIEGLSGLESLEHLLSFVSFSSSWAAELPVEESIITQENTELICQSCPKLKTFSLGPFRLYDLDFSCFLKLKNLTELELLGHGREEDDEFDTNEKFILKHKSSFEALRKRGVKVTLIDNREYPDSKDAAPN